MATITEHRRIIATSALVTIGVGTIAGIHRGEDLPTARFLVGVGLAFTVCSILNDFGSGLGAGFAALIMVAAILGNGEDALKALMRRSRQGSTPAQRKLDKNAGREERRVDRALKRGDAADAAAALADRLNPFI